MSPTPKTSHRLRRIPLLLIALALVTAAWANTLPFDTVVHGHFRRMVHSGDTRGQVALGALPKASGRWGVGALEGLRGELIQIDGQLLVSRGDDAEGRVQPPRDGERAVLFVGAQVRDWVEVPLPGALDAAGLERFVVEQAQARGIDVEQPFPFLVDGRFPTLVWHVVTGTAPAPGGPARHGPGHGGHGAHGGGHANTLSGLRVFEQPGAEGRLVGFYSGRALEGVVSHPGERTHLHFIDAARRVSGHVDAHSVAAGGVLRLPS